MDYNKTTLFSLLLFFTIPLVLSGQNTYMAASTKMTQLLDTKYLKTGEIVLIERVRGCDYTRIKLLKQDKSEETIFFTGTSVYYKFNELPDNNWVLVLITDATDDVPEPLEFHTITFIDGNISSFTTKDNETEIELSAIQYSAVINNNELILVGGSIAYYTDYILESVTKVTLDKALTLFKSPNPKLGVVYYKYVEEDAIKTTQDMFENEDVMAFDLGPEFQDIHYLSSYTILQRANEIFGQLGLTGLFYIEQDKEIFDFRQHGQNLRYYTISEDSILTFKKIYLDESFQLQFDSLTIDLKTSPPIQNLHWDHTMLGYSFNQKPLKPSLYEDDYRGRNYVFNYNLDNKTLSTQTHDVSIDEIEYAITPDFENYIDINLNVTLTNHSDEPIWDVHLHSAAFEGINCANNALKVVNDIITIEANESVTVEANYESMYVNSNLFQQPSLCVYALGANNEFDDKFEDNIFCLNMSEILSSDDQNAKDHLTLYPNPARDYVQVDNIKVSSILTIYNLFGVLMKKVQTNAEHKIDISDLESGVYIMVDAKTGSSTSFTKI